VYVRVGSATRTFVVPPGAGDMVEAAVGLTAESPVGEEIPVDAAGLPGEIVVGLVVPGTAGTARWEERIPLASRPVTGELTLLVPGLGWRQVPSRADEGWLPAPVRPTLTVSATGA
jgi:hypothetical protein